MSSPTADGAGFAGLAREDILRRRRQMGRWKRRSAVVRTLRVVLPALCVAIVAAIAGLAGINTFLLRTASHQPAQPQIRMLKPHFQGRNDSGQPFLITADSAVRDDVDASRVELDRPVFMQGSSPADQTRVSSDHGVYREDTHMLDLEGDVTLDSANGYHFVSAHALVDTEKNNVDGDRPVTGHGPLGQLAASAYAVRNGGAYLYFNGHVRTRIEHGGPAAAPERSDAVAGPPATPH